MQSLEYINYIASKISENGPIGISGSCGASGIIGTIGISGSCGTSGTVRPIGISESCGTSVVSGKTYNEEKLPILEIYEFIPYNKNILKDKRLNTFLDKYSNSHYLYE